mgnify:CR=1 FL=1
MMPVTKIPILLQRDHHRKVKPVNKVSPTFFNKKENTKQIPTLLKKQNKNG